MNGTEFNDAIARHDSYELEDAADDCLDLALENRGTPLRQKLVRLAGTSRFQPNEASLINEIMERYPLSEDRNAILSDLWGISPENVERYFTNQQGRDSLFKTVTLANELGHAELPLTPIRLRDMHAFASALSEACCFYVNRSKGYADAARSGATPERPEDGLHPTFSEAAPGFVQKLPLACSAVLFHFLEDHERHATLLARPLSKKVFPLDPAMQRRLDSALTAIADSAWSDLYGCELARSALLPLRNEPRSVWELLLNTLSIHWPAYLAYRAVRLCVGARPRD